MTEDSSLPDERNDAVRRLTWLIGALLLWCVAILARLFSLQVLHHDRYLKLANQQQQHTVEISAPRGSIFDRNGHPLAMSVPVDSVFVNPLLVPNLSVAAAVIAPILSLNEEDLYSRLKWSADNHRGFMWVKRKIAPEEAQRLRDLHCEWIEFHNDSHRHYPSGSVAAHVIGAVYRGEEGAAGVERGLDAELRGRPGQAKVLMDVKRRGIDSVMATPAQPGQSVTLTIDQRIQFIAERELAIGVAKHHARSGTAMVMNPYTGEILALANFPTYNPNIPPKQGDDPMSRFNLGVSVPFEPGSIFKVITLSTALETTRLNPNSMINCMNGHMKLPGRVIHEAHRGFGMLSMAQVLEKSSNIGAIQISFHIGERRMYEYVRRFGFGQTTGVPLPPESAGKLRKLDHWGKTSLASIAMGQEISTTSVQLARACSVIANGGLLVKPKLVLTRAGQSVPDVAPQRILKPETAFTMRRLMEGVVLRGTAKGKANLDGYSSAGKTGTAQIFDSRTHHYTHFYNASFMGFAPVTKPALVTVVTLNGTTGGSGMGGQAAAPVFQAIMTEALRIYDVPKDLPEIVEEDNSEPVDTNDLSIAELSEHPIMEEDDAPVTAPGFLPTIQNAVLSVKPNGPLVPDFRGKTVREVIEESAEMGIELLLDGSGVARAQLPPAGTPLIRGDRIRVQFAR